VVLTSKIQPLLAEKVLPLHNHHANGPKMVITLLTLMTVYTRKLPDYEEEAIKTAKE